MCHPTARDTQPLEALALVQALALVPVQAQARALALVLFLRLLGYEATDQPE